MITLEEIKVGDCIQVYSGSWLHKRRVVRILEDGRIVAESNGHNLDYELSQIFRKVSENHLLWEKNQNGRE